jgi:hypothetical protein
MKYSLVVVVLAFLSSASQARQYSWNFMDIGFSEDGLGSGPSYAVSSDFMSNLFARTSILRHQQQTDTKPINSLFSFFTAGYQYRSLFFEAGVSQYDICWYACAGYTGNIVMAGLAGGSGSLRAKFGVGTLNIMDQRWSVFEADASYAINQKFGISFGIMDINDLTEKITKFSLRMTW